MTCSPGFFLHPAFSQKCGFLCFLIQIPNSEPRKLNPRKSNLSSKIWIRAALSVHSASSFLFAPSLCSSWSLSMSAHLWNDSEYILKDRHWERMKGARVAEVRSPQPVELSSGLNCSRQGYKLRLLMTEALVHHGCLVGHICATFLSQWRFP